MFRDLVSCPILDIKEKRRAFSRHTDQLIDIHTHKGIVDTSHPPPCPRLIQYAKRRKHLRELQLKLSDENIRTITAIKTPKQKTTKSNQLIWTKQLPSCEEEFSISKVVSPTLRTTVHKVIHDEGMTVVDESTKIKANVVIPPKNWGRNRTPRKGKMNLKVKVKLNQKDRRHSVLELQREFANGKEENETSHSVLELQRECANGKEENETSHSAFEVQTIENQLIIESDVTNVRLSDLNSNEQNQNQFQVVRREEELSDSNSNEQSENEFEVVRRDEELSDSNSNEQSENLRREEELSDCLDKEEFNAVIPNFQMEAENDCKIELLLGVSEEMKPSVLQPELTETFDDFLEDNDEDEPEERCQDQSGTDDDDENPHLDLDLTDFEEY
jgi:hypothetical protein